MTRGIHNQKLKEEAIRLRLDERLSYKEITEKLNVPKSTLSNWLSALPLTKSELKRKQLARKTFRKDRGCESEWHKSFDPSSFGRNQKAKIAESAILFRLFIHGFSVYGSLFDGDIADWVIDKDGQTFKIQVRWTKQDAGLPTIPLTRTSHGKKTRLDSKDYDFIVGYNFYNDTAYVFSFKETANNTTSITITDESAEAWHKIS